MRVLKIFICYTMIVAFLLGLSLGIAAETNDKVENGEFQNVSIYRLLATPSDFHNKKVRVTGFLKLEHEGNALYANETDFQLAILQNSIWLSLKKSNYPSFDEGYATVQGIFNAKETGHFGLFSGALIDIRSIEKKLSRSELLDQNK